jgi:hypothetical protein
MCAPDTWNFPTEGTSIFRLIWRAGAMDAAGAPSAHGLENNFWQDRNGIRAIALQV